MADDIAATLGRRVREDAAPLRWVFCGDSITHGALHTEGSRDYVQIAEERVRYELARHRDVFIRTAISGQTSAGLLDDFDHQALAHRPDILSIMIGMNDAARVDLDATVANLAAAIERFGPAPGGPWLILHTTNPAVPGFDPGREPKLPAINDAIRAAADAPGVMLVDHLAHWEEEIAARPLRRISWMADGIHPNAQGHRAFARLFLRRLGLWDDATRCCGELIC